VKSSESSDPTPKNDHSALKLCNNDSFFDFIPVDPEIGGYFCFKDDLLNIIVAISPEAV